jgi:2-phosphoglycolate phosphatase
MLKAVFFDLDGTLLDTALDLGAALNACLREDGLPEVENSIIRTLVSDGALSLVRHGYDIATDHPKIPQLRQRLLDHYAGNVAEHTRLFPGMQDVLNFIAKHNLAWGIATNKPWLYTDLLLKHFDFARTPCCVICPDHVAQRKPHPESLAVACEAAQCQISEAIYVGDHKRDIDCAINANMLSVCANYGYISKSHDTSSWRADYYIEHAQDLIPILEGLLINHEH